MTMRSTNTTHLQKVQRNLTAFSCAPEEQRRRDGLLRNAWNLITDGFTCKPEPKTAWYETATGDFTPWKKVVTPIRSAIVAAYKTGDKELIEQTLEGARAFCRELEADFVSLVPSESEESLLALAIQETELEGAANPVQMALAANPNCPTSAERAIGPLNKHYLRLGALLDKCRRHARTSRTSALVLNR